MDSRLYRDLIGRFATGVTVITTNVDGFLHGMTANAVSSVSLDPILLVVCVGHGSTCLEQLSHSDHFAVSILGSRQRALSDLFAQRAEPEEGSLRGADFEMTSNEVPRLSGCVGWLECRLHDRVVAGDHDLVLGEVIDGEIGEDEDGPLVFFEGRYAGLAG